MHVVSRWRRASHESLANALGRPRGARALFERTNEAIDYAKHGDPLYVIVWHEEANEGQIAKPDRNEPGGLRLATISVADILRFEEADPPSNEQLETYFERGKVPLGVAKIGLTTAAKTELDLERELQERIAQSRNLDAMARRGLLELSEPMPRRVEISTTAFVRNPHVIVEVLLRADGYCERCGGEAPFKRASDGTPYLEVHHVVALAKGGPDTIANAQALCPNCHREQHLGVNED